MTFVNTLALFGAMIVLAAIPGPGTFAVMARSASGGMLHGLVTTIGIVFGDYVFIALCLSGLAYIADVMGNAFVILKYVGAAYLIWLGLSLLRARGTAEVNTTPKQSSLASSWLLGLTTTLGNPKAILFYLSFFPAFLPIKEITVMDTIIIFVVVTLAVGGVMLTYAWATVRAQAILKNRTQSRLFNYVGGATLIGSGIWMAARGN
ncbi:MULTISPECIES: LysE family translocator [Microbulbifer]|uniref:LysE family translocator n=1 Tax=Microbulbifer TaxID=48073 RepID=UPI001CD3974A|nr:LysE family translocator [Microbulbifer agarilyticus]MCA0899853.1 LysE family translocator [Microbulbifer agarilyticus]